jgi:hypothetical protein
VLQFRHSIAPFYLRRRPTSMYEGQHIVDQSIIIPVPFMEDLDDPDDSTGKYYAQARQLASSTFTSDGIKVRSNNARVFAWSSLFADWHRVESDPNLSAKEKLLQPTNLMRSQVKRTAPSPSVRKLVGLLKMIIVKKERFVIVGRWMNSA